MNSKLSTIAIVLALSTSLSGCGKSAPKAETAGAKAAAPASTSAAAPAASQAAAPAGQAPVGDVSGTVLETMDAGGYTYLKLKTSGGEAWAAVNQTPVKVGDPVTVFGAMPMDGFESPTLKRKFDRIYFGTIAPAGMPPAAAPAGAADKKLPAMPPGHGGEKKEVDLGPIKVDKASGPEGKTVAEVFAQRTALKGKTVAVRAKVVKYLPGIMGKNWVHLQDGTGAKAKKDHDLTVTTQETIKVGDVVTVRGKLDVDKDVGAGYEFPAIIDDAKFTK